MAGQPEPEQEPEWRPPVTTSRRRQRSAVPCCAVLCCCCSAALRDLPLHRLETSSDAALDACHSSGRPRRLMLRDSASVRGGSVTSRRGAPVSPARTEALHGLSLTGPSQHRHFTPVVLCLHVLFGAGHLFLEGVRWSLPPGTEACEGVWHPYSDFWATRSHNGTEACQALQEDTQPYHETPWPHKEPLDHPLTAVQTWFNAGLTQATPRATVVWCWILKCWGNAVVNV